MKRFLNIFLAIFISLNISSISIASDINSNDFANLKKHGVNYYENGYYEDALFSFLKIPYEKMDEEVCLLIANSYESIGQSQLAIEILNRLVEINSHNYKAYYNLGNLYLKVERYDDAIKAYNACISFKKDYSPAYYNAGLCFYKLEDYKESAKYYKKAIKYNPEKSSYYFNIALSYKSMKKDRTANKYFKLYSEHK